MEIGLRRRTLDFEVRCFVADGFEAPARVSDRDLLDVEAGAERLRRLVGGAHLIFQVVEGAQILVQLALGRGNRLAQVLAPRHVAFQLAATRGDAILELAGRFFETLHLGGERAAALDERGVGRLGLGRRARLLGGRFARFEEALLCRRQLLVRASLFGFDPLNGLTRFFLALFLRAQLLFGGAAFDGDLRLLARHTVRGLAGRGGLELEADDRLLLTVQFALERRDRRFGARNRHIQRRHVLAHPRQRSLFLFRAFAQLLDFPLGRQDAARFGAYAPFDAVRAPEDFAVRRRRGAAGLQRERARVLARRAQPNGRNQRLNGVAGRGIPGHEESDAPRSALARELQPGGGIVVCADDDVLKQIAERRVDRALVFASHVDVVGDRPQMGQRSAGFGQDDARAFAVLGAGGGELLERLQPRAEAGEVVFAAAQLAFDAFARAARRGELHLTRRPIDMQRVHRLARALERVFRDGAFVRGALRLDLQIVALDVQLAQLLADAHARSGGVLHRMAEGRRGVDGGVYFASRGFDVGLQAFDCAGGRRVRPLLARERLGGAFAFRGGAVRRPAAVGQLEARRLPPRVERVNLRFERGRRRGERLDLLLVERDLLLQPADRQFARMRGFARRGRPRVGLGQLEAKRFERGLDPRQVR